MPDASFRRRTLDDLITARLSRRQLLKSAGLLAGAGALAASPLRSIAALAQEATALSTLTFAEVAHAYETTHALAEGYTATALLRWGDPLFNDSPPFTPGQPDASAQERQFGYNADYTMFMPLPKGSDSSDHGLLWVNHEYTDRPRMFPELSAQEVQQRAEHLQTERQKADGTWKEVAGGVTAMALPQQLLDAARLELEVQRTRTELAAHGGTIAEIRKTEEGWNVVRGSKYNRRISGLSTEMTISGPAAGDARMQTKDDPTGANVIGMLGNCAGGHTPWGTVLTCEENINYYFGGSYAGTAEERNHKRFGLQEKPGYYVWWQHIARFNVEKEPHEPNRFGWVVEIDPYDPASKPVKRTALGRIKHESATVALCPDGRVAIYSGDDQKFEYLYRYVSTNAYDPATPETNATLLDEGTLYVAWLQEDGTLTWLPLEYGKHPLDASNGFASQADVLIETRTAADLMGATPMDRPEDVEVHPATGHVFVSLTKNEAREKADKANPRTRNLHGHILELMPPLVDGKADHAALQYKWDIFLMGGDPSKPEDRALYPGKVSEHGWLSCPDNLAFDPKGRLWIGTDGLPGTPARVADGLFACDTQGAGRGITRHFFRAPIGAEVTGPTFTPDGKTLFLSIQHPGENSTYAAPSTRWPDFEDDLPPRPSVLVITKNNGGEIGS